LQASKSHWRFVDASGVDKKGDQIFLQTLCERLRNERHSSRSFWGIL